MSGSQPTLHWPQTPQEVYTEDTAAPTVSGSPAAAPLVTESPDVAPDVESWLPVYCLFGTLLVFFVLGGFWIWHFAR
jgi:hypothetical protein